MISTQQPTTPNIPIKAALIDDIFDEIQSNEISLDTLKGAIQYIDNEPRLQKLFEEFKKDIPDLDEVSEDNVDLLSWLNKLWLITFSSGPLSDYLLDKVFDKRAEKKSQLAKVCAQIEACGIEVSTYGEVDIENRLGEFEEEDYKIIFVDYYLNYLDTESGKDRAIQVARLINQKRKENRPITVLMSSHPNAEAQQKAFRASADLTQAAFQFISKSDLADQNTASIYVNSIIHSLDYTDQIHNYILSLSNAADNALKKFQHEIKSLSIDDYAFIQYAKLNKDKHPLGDYMNWLFESRWGSLLYEHTDFLRQQRQLDSIQIKSELRICQPPSDHIAKMYASALFDEHVEELGPHPMYDDPNRFYLHTGDIFSNAKKLKTWLLINPQCDLERQPPDARSILLVPGILSPITESLSSISTDFLLLGQNTFKVAWEIKEVLTVNYGGFKEWLAGNELVRSHRLKLPFALQIQQEFSASITRVGTPVAPPIMQLVTIELLTKDFLHSTTKKLVEVPGSLSVIRKVSSEKKAITLANGPLSIIKRTIISHVNDIETLKANGSLSSQQIKGLDRMKTFLNEFEAWFFQEHPLTFTSYKSNAIKVVQDGTSTMQIDTLFVLNVKSRPSEENAEVAFIESDSNETHT